MKTTLSCSILATFVAVLCVPVTSHAASTLLDFTSTGGTILDAQGQGTGFTTRLSGTGAGLAANDTNLDIDTTSGTLSITTGDGTGSNQDFNGTLGMDTTEALGMNLSSLGYTGSEDFIVTASFNSLPSTENPDQAGIFIGQDSANLTRTGIITFAAQEFFSSHTTAGADNNGRFFGFGFDGSDGMNVAITRIGGDWRYFIDGVEWQPNTAADGTGTPVDPTGANGSPDLDSQSDLTVGLFAINVINANSETYDVDSFRVIVDPVLGDADGNESVGVEDFTLISDNLFNNVVPGTNGDVTFDGFVGYDDFRTWKNAAPLSALQAVGVAIPEPATASLLLLACLGVSFCGRRNNR